jgi:hypothetical protein
MLPKKQRLGGCTGWSIVAASKMSRRFCDVIISTFLNMLEYLPAYRKQFLFRYILFQLLFYLVDKLVLLRFNVSGCAVIFPPGLVSFA